MTTPESDTTSRKAPGRGGVTSVLLGLLATAALLLAGCGPGEIRAAEDAGAADAPPGAAAAAPVPPPPTQGPGRVARSDSTPAAHVHRRHGEAPTAGAPSEHSIYHVGGGWRNRFGDDVALAELGGRVQLVALVYTNCSYACPRIVATMKRIEGALGPDYADRVGFTLVSIDPERDVPERLEQFGEKSRLDPDRWTLLNGGDGDVLALSVLLGVKYRATGDGEFAHSNVITVLDPGGEVVHRIEGLNAPVEPALLTIRRVAP